MTKKLLENDCCNYHGLVIVDIFFTSGLPWFFLVLNDFFPSTSSSSNQILSNASVLWQMPMSLPCT